MPKNHTCKTFSIPADLNNEFVKHVEKNFPEMSLSRWIHRAIRNEMKRDRRMSILELTDGLDDKTKDLLVEELQKKTEYSF